MSRGLPLTLFYLLTYLPTYLPFHLRSYMSFYLLSYSLPFQLLPCYLSATMASSNQIIISNQFLYCIAQPHIADKILSYSFTLTTLQSLIDISIKNKKNYPTLQYMQQKANYKFNCVFSLSMTILQNYHFHSNSCPQCGMLFANNPVHFSTHLTSLKKIKFQVASPKLLIF